MTIPMMRLMIEVTQSEARSSSAYENHGGNRFMNGFQGLTGLPTEQETDKTFFRRQFEFTIFWLINEFRYMGC